MEKECKEREKHMEKERKERGGQGDRKPQKTKEFIEDVVKCHNRYRKKHGKVRINHSKLTTASSGYLQEQFC